MSTEAENQVFCERYELERVVREDALGRTWRAVDLKGTAKVDVRMLPDWAGRAEAQSVLDAVKALSHPGIVSTLDMVADGDLAAYVLEANDGETMQQRRARRPRRHFEISEIKPWLRSIAEALAYLHGQGRVHGALHIGSFLIEGAVLKITDVAVAPLLVPQAQSEGRAALPAAAMSPEVLDAKKPGVADDIYGLGAVIYDLLTGQPLFFSGDICTQVKCVVPPSVQDRRAQLEISSAPLAEAWEDWIAAALSKDAKRRPSLDDLGLLIRSGQFGGKTSQGTAARSAAATTTSPASSAPAADNVAPARAKVPRNLLVLGCSILLAVAIIAGVYVFKVKPHREFTAALDAAYHAALKFDDTTPAQHDTVIQRWQKFESEWQARVRAGHPESQPTLVLAQQKRLTRELAKTREAERERQESERKLKAHVAGARAAFDIAKVKAAAAGAMSGEALAVWKEFITKFDVDFQGSRPDGIAPMIAEARAAQQSIEKAIADEKKERENFIAQRAAELAALDQVQPDASVPAPEKVRRVEAFIAAFASAPANVQGEPSFAAIKSRAETKLESLRSAALAETPAMPLDPEAIFASPAARGMSKNSRQRLLKNVQESLKTAGHFAGEPSGAADKSTQDALVAFQNANKLTPTGALDDPTLTALKLAEITDDETPTPATAGRMGGKSKSKPKEEKKTVLQKTGDGVKKVGSAIGNFFTGKKK